MSSNVVDLPVITSLNLDPHRVLSKAIEAGLEDVVILGRLPGGEEYFASSLADATEVVWLLERCKFKLLYAA